MLLGLQWSTYTRCLIWQSTYYAVHFGARRNDLRMGLFILFSSSIRHYPVAILRQSHTALAKHKHTKCWDMLGQSPDSIPPNDAYHGRSMFCVTSFQFHGDLCCRGPCFMSLTIRTIGLSHSVTGPHESRRLWVLVAKGSLSLAARKVEQCQKKRANKVCSSPLRESNSQRCQTKLLPSSRASMSTDGN